MPTTTYQAMLVNHENDRHARRLAEIKRAAPQLRLFEPVAAALAAKGLDVVNGMARAHFDGHLFVSRGGLTEWDNPLHAALIELGFAEISNTVIAGYASCELQKGELTVSLQIKPTSATAAETSRAPYSRRAVDQNLSASASSPVAEEESQLPQQPERAWLAALPAWDGQERLQHLIGSSDPASDAAGPADTPLLPLPGPVLPRSS